MQDVIIATVRAIYSKTESPVKTIAIAQRCYVSRWTAQRRLRELMDAGLVNRVGQRGGYLPANMN